MAKQTIDLGTQGTQSGDSVRAAFDKANDNFDELYTDMLKALAYSGSVNTDYSSSSSSWVYGSTFGDTLPAGTYLFIGTAQARPTVTYPSDMKMRIAFFNANNDLLAGNFMNVNQDGMQTGFCIGIISLTSSISIKPGVYKVSGTGTAKAGYWRWYAIKIKEAS